MVMMFSLMRTVSSDDVLIDEDGEYLGSDDVCDLVFKIVVISAVLIINSDIYIKSIKIMHDFFDC